MTSVSECGSRCLTQSPFDELVQKAPVTGAGTISTLRSITTGMLTHIRVLPRLLWVSAVFLVAGAEILALMILLCIAPNSQWRIKHRIGHCIRRSLQCVGGAWVKIGQLMSYRQDLFGREIADQLACLTTEAIPVAYDPKQVIAESLGAERISEFACDWSSPINSGSIADVFVGTHAIHGRVAIKLVRPKEARRLHADTTCLRGLAFLCRIGRLELLGSVAKALGQMRDVCLRQLDMSHEACHIRRCIAHFSMCQDVWIPKPYADLSNKHVLTMEYIAPLTSLRDARGRSAEMRAIRNGLHALYRMLFQTRLVHCDMHPGNVYLANNGKVVLLDFGLMNELTAAQAEKFRRFFWGIAANRSKSVVDALLSGIHSPLPSDRFSAFSEDVRQLVERHHRATVGQFQIAAFVSSLFSLLRSHQIRFDDDFVFPVTALLVFEGLLKNVDPSLDFQRIAMPFFFDLAIRDVVEWNADPQHKV